MSKNPPQNSIFNNIWQNFVVSGDLSTLIMALVLLFMPILALKASDWPLRLDITLPVTVASVLFGYFLARSRYNEFYALIVSLIYGVVVVLLVAAFILMGFNLLAGVENVLARTIQWIFDAATGGINQDTLVFSLIVAILFWFFGYNTAWHLFRLDRVWRVIVPPGLILLVNMVVYAGDVDLDGYLLIFVFVSLLFVVRNHLDEREWDWYTNGVRVPKRFRQQFTLVGAGLALCALLIAWAIPSNTLQERLDNFHEFLNSDPVQRMTEFWNRLIEPIESEGPPTADYYGGDSLNLGGAIRLGDQRILWVNAPSQYRYYWRSRVFENYSNGSWSPSATRRVPDLTPPLEINHPAGTDGGRTTINQTITMDTSSRLIYGAPHPVSVDLQGRIDLLRTNGNQDDPSSPVNISVIRPLRVLEPGDSYTVTSAISTASAYDLRAAGTNYPQWVISPNTYAGGISPRTATLARQIVEDAGAVTPYDRAKAIERWLRENITYNESIPPPPSNVDIVDWLLFDAPLGAGLREGYCTYYATSMVMMLRSLGIPARMAAGFAEGNYDFATGQYIVLERDAHTWVEVYFPGYGWVEFEPTAAQAPLDRDGDTNPQTSPPLNPNANATPTLTPTPLASPTPQVSPTPPNPQESPTPDSQFPTITPTPSPTFTPTPIIVPTVPPPVQPPEPPQGFLEFLLPAIGIAVLIILAVILLVLVLLFLWWWWEWRGMGGLSPVTRAYARLERYLRLIGLRTDEADTTEERRMKIVRVLPRAERPVTAITRLYTVERYSKAREGSAQSAENAQVADNAWLDARKNILMRWLRRLIPFVRD